MNVLGIESTCDETACAIVRAGSQILSNVISSQIDLQKEFGGVVPELACRRHSEVIIPVIDQALKEAEMTFEEIDLIAVSYGPGLIGALLIGLNAAKSLSLALDKPLIGINHIEAHLFAALMSQEETLPFPALGIVLSGGHTSLVKVNSIGDYQLISETVDDAIGEAFDKVAKMLNLPYPGGPEIEKLALKGNPFRYSLKAGQIKGKPFHFSFSGIKTGALYTIKEEGDALVQCDLAASFQHAAFSDVVKKAKLAAKMHSCKSMILGGGVTNNRYLQYLFNELTSDFQIQFPKSELTLDNAAMIAGLAFHRYQHSPDKTGLFLEAKTRIPDFSI